ncbi:MAG TPA: hypothetical protein VLY23_02115 [Candidatus Acidoferrum sp.]|nr:hypothetical protein [Candidatus Acidoferrum sp.]
MGRSLAFILAAIVLAFLIVPRRQVVAEQAAQPSEYALSNGATIVLPADWTPRPVTQVPPPTALAPSAPLFNFSDFFVFQNNADYSQLEFALSNNPLLGHDAYWLDGEMHRPSSTAGGMVSYLFYFFFPPPPSCLNGASAAYDRAARDSASDDGKDTARDVRISFDCQYAPTLSDFYSYLVSPSVTFRREGGAEHREGALRGLYLLPMDQQEFNGQTFFIFEAQGQRQISLATTNRFNLPDSLQGAQADFLWAMGAPSPFPFVHDASYKNVPLVQVVYGGIGLGANKKADFLRILHAVQMPRN